MTASGKPISILVADDDSDDRMMIREAFDQCGPCDLHFVEDGEQLMARLRTPRCAPGSSEPTYPSIVLLDLNMPKMSGREVLQEMKSDPQLRHIPIVVFTTSQAEEDVVRSYGLGVNSFISKPVSFEGVVTALYRYWAEIVTLPPQE